MLLDLRSVPDRMRLLLQTFKELLSSLEEVLSEIRLAGLTLIFCKMLPQALSVRDFLADFTRHLTLTSPELPELDWCLVEILHNNVHFLGCSVFVVKRPRDLLHKLGLRAEDSR